MANVTLLKGAALTYMEGLLTTERNRALAAEAALNVLISGRAPASHTHPASQISDATSYGRALLTAANRTAQRTLLELGPLATLTPSGSPTDQKYLRGDNKWETLPDLTRYWAFTASGTWSKPANLPSNSMVFVEAWGGGGGGGGGYGGGGGGYMSGWFRLSSLSSTVAVTVGAGGVAADTGGTGGKSMFGSYLSAYGGGGGARNNAALHPGAGGQPWASGGDAVDAGGKDAVSEFFGGNGGPFSGSGGRAIRGGGGGATTTGVGGSSVFGGNGGDPAENGSVRGGGGGAAAGVGRGNGGRGEVRVWI